MRHDIHISGSHYGLRPIRLEDAALIVEFRRDPDRTRFLRPIVADIAVQESYLQDYFARPNDYYFVIEDLDALEPVGLIAIYDVDREQGGAEVGRWIVRPGSPAAVESALLIYRVAFERLELREVTCLTMADNRHVISFHNSCGLEYRGERTDDVGSGEPALRRTEHALTLVRWPAVEEKLARLASVVK